MDRSGSFWRTCLGTASWICLSVIVGGTYGRASLFHASCRVSPAHASSKTQKAEGAPSGSVPGETAPLRNGAGLRGVFECSPLLVLGPVLEHRRRRRRRRRWEDADRGREKGRREGQSWRWQDDLEGVGKRARWRRRRRWRWKGWIWDASSRPGRSCLNIGAAFSCGGSRARFTARPRRVTRGVNLEICART